MAYTFDELLAVLKSSADAEYLRPFFDAGYGSGLESFEALVAVLLRVDQAIERTTQALYIRPFSGQTSPPASGQLYAEVEVAITRTAHLDIALVLGAGEILFEEIEVDAGRLGGVLVHTGRQFILQSNSVFLPGETGPALATLVATRPNYGCGTIQAGKLRGIVQPGAGFQNVRASIDQTPSIARLVVQPDPDVVVPEHVGQYVQLVGGANEGAVRRIIGYDRADSTVPHGGVASLSGTFVGRALGSGPTSPFLVGEAIEQYDSLSGDMLARGVLLAVGNASPWYIVIETAEGEFQATGGTVEPLVGVTSLANFAVEDVCSSGKLTPETATAAWRVLPWSEMGLAVQNTGYALPGTIGILDALGEERGIARSPGEDDESYRKRIAEIADVVSPNAIRRVGNRIWAPWQAEVCLREVGGPKLPGVYCDGVPGDPSSLSRYAYDLDGLLLGGAKTGTFFEGERVFQEVDGVLTVAHVTTTLAAVAVGLPVPAPDPRVLEVANLRGPGFQLGLPIVGEVSGASFLPTSLQYGLRPEDRFKLDLDYTEFRAFFLVGVPPSPLGEFGIPYDAPHPYNAYDSSPYLGFADGFPLTAAVLNRATWQGIARARAGGVGFDLYQEGIGCV